MNLKDLINKIPLLWNQKRYHEITKLWGEYSPFLPRNHSISYKEAYIGWVYTAITIIATTTAKLPFHVTGKWDKQIEHEYSDLITYSLIENIVSYLKLCGRVYIWKNIIGGRIRWLEVLRPDLVEPLWSANKTEIIKYKYTVNGKVISFKPQEIIPILNFNPAEAYPYQTMGYSDIQASAIAIDTDNASSTWNWKFFENSANPGFVLETEKDLTPEQAERVYTAWVNKFKNVNNAHKPALLTSGLKAKEISPSQKEMDFVEQRRFSRDEILAIFKVPKAVLGLWDGTAGTMNIRSYQEIFAQNAIEPIARRIQDAFNIHIFKDIGYFEFYDIIPKDEAILRADYTNNAITLNEYRAMRGYWPLKGGDKLYSDIIVDGVSVKALDEPKKIETKSVFDSLADALTKGLSEGETKILKRDKRLTKYEEQFKKVVSDIAKEEEKYVLSLIKEKKAVEKPNISLGRFSALWTIRVAPIYKALLESEGQIALSDVAEGTFVLNATMKKKIKENAYLLSLSVDKTTKEKLVKVFENGIADGLGAYDMTQKVKGVFQELSTSRAEAIARTETIRTHNDATVEGWTQSGVVEKKQWYTAHDDRVSEICASLDGKIITLGENYFDKGDKLTVWNNTYNFDYWDTSWPPSHVNCRCTLLPIIK